MASRNLSDIVNTLVESSPPAELNEVKEDLLHIISKDNAIVIQKATENYVFKSYGVFSSSYVVSKYNKSQGSLKYIDFIGKRLFDIDMKNQKAIDFEDYIPEVEYPQYFDKLVENLRAYTEEKYLSDSAFTVIPGASSIHIIIIGQKVNPGNFYTGRSVSHYEVDFDGSIKGDFDMDIHYYEEGNVRLMYKDHYLSSVSKVDSSDIVNKIDKFETSTTLKIVDEFNQLNIKYFKNLRRLLPVTRSKINWGKAIGNYRLGSDVVNKR